MKLTVKFLEGIRDKTGEKLTEFEFPNLNSLNMYDFICTLIKKYGQALTEIMFWKISPNLIEDFLAEKRDLKIDQIKFLINGDISSYDKTKLLKDGDVIVLFLPLAGG
jgi:molybdopterin converting factor small subunit